jgi:signal transduction histidine kinase
MSSMTTRKILLVDDSVDDRAIIHRLLQKQPRVYTVVNATSGAEALRLAREEHFGCILLDFRLPDMDGIAFLDAIAERSGRQRIPIAILTGHQSDEVAVEALKRGAQDYLVKDGLTAPSLVRAIENAIEKHTIQQELTESRIAVELRNRKLEVLRDQLQEKVAELAEATKAKDQFLAVMSHEMRTPLNAIIGYADLLDMELDGVLTAGQREQVGRIQVGSRHLLDLINDVLDLARADARKLDLDLRPVDVGAVVEEVTALLERQARQKDIELIEEPWDASIPHVQADLHRLRQVLTNLIGNAIKFTDEGSIRVRCEREGDETVLVHVTDTGLGIDPAVLPLVFGEFYQAAGDLTREKGGSGLGLAISQRLANLMGGEIRAVSTPGEGSTFTLSLRAAALDSELRADDVEGHLQRMEMRAADTRLRSASPAVSVVAFGDHEEALSELERQVSPRVKLVWTTDPTEVPGLAAREKASLVVLDIASADGAAWPAAHALQDVPELAHTAILLLPSLPEVTRDEDTGGLDLGWLSLVPKPFTAAQLTRAVSTAARGHEDGAEEGDDRPARRFDVLVVDDDPDSRRVAATFLAQAQLAVRMAPDGESGLVEMHRSPPDVVVLDLMMPVLDGFGVLATMRADPVLARTPVVVLTAKSLTDAERRFLSRTAVRVLQKGEHRLADVAALVMRAAVRTRPDPDSDSVDGSLPASVARSPSPGSSAPPTPDPDMEGS